MFLNALGQLLLGMSAGLAMSAVESADAEMTRHTVEQAQHRVGHLRAEADRRAGDVYDRCAAWMTPSVRAAFRRRMTT